MMMLESTVPAVSGLGGAMALGQAVDTVTIQEVKDYLADQGYEPYTPVVEPVVPTVPEVAYLSKWEAIAIATDMALEIQWYAPEAYTIPHTPGHRHVCPGYPGSTCQIPEAVWIDLLLWTQDAANGFLAGRYGLPNWYQQITGEDRRPPGLTGLSGVSSLGSTWVEQNPWAVKIVGDAISTWGEFLTAKLVTEEIKKAIPTGALTKDDLPALIAALKASADPEQADKIERGAEAALMPSWLLPALLAGGGVLVYLLLIKR